MKFVYKGAVRTPPDSFPRGGGTASVDFHRREYIVSTKDNEVGRLSMVPPGAPRIAMDGDRRLLLHSSVPVAPLVSRKVDPSNKTWHTLNDADNAGDGALAEVCVVGDKALIAGKVYYDATARQDVSFLVCDWPLPDSGSVPGTPWRSVRNLGEGWAAGPMAVIPERYRDVLFGDLLFGQPGGLPIVTRQSFGPCAISAYARDFVRTQDVPASLLLGYHDGQLATWGKDANNTWNSATIYNSIVFVGEYVLFIGRHGYGEPCYGKGTADPSMHLVPDPTDGGVWVFDPTAGGKGTHAYPYRTQALGYRVLDLADVAAGRRKYWEIMPAFWQQLDIPFFDRQHYPPLPLGTIPRTEIGGADYDSEACELHICAVEQDSYGWDPGPLWHVFKVDEVSPAPNPLPLLTSMPAPQPEEPAPTPTPSLESRVKALEDWQRIVRGQ